MALEEMAIHRDLKALFLADTGAGGLNTAGLSNIGARVAAGVAPQKGWSGVTFPYIRHQALSLLPAEALGPQHCGLDAIWLIAVVVQSENLFDTEAAAARIHTLLYGRTATLESTSLFYLPTERRTEYPVVDGKSYREWIGLWDVRAQAA